MAKKKKAKVKQKATHKKSAKKKQMARKKTSKKKVSKKKISKKKKSSKKKTIYKVSNYGNTRSVFVAGQSWECPKNGSILTDNKEVADGFESMFAVDIEVMKKKKGSVKS